MRGHAYLLEHIKRKIANPKSIVASNESGEKIVLKPELMNKVLSDVKQMKGKQESLDAKFSAMKQENEALWREVAILRQKHIKQQQIVNNVSISSDQVPCLPVTCFYITKFSFSLSNSSCLWYNQQGLEMRIVTM